MTPNLSAPNNVLYRRVIRLNFDKRSGRPRAEAFRLREHEANLSMYAASIVTPRQLLELVIQEKQNQVEKLAKLPAPDELQQKKLNKERNWLQSYPNAEAVYRDYCIAEIYVGDILAMQKTGAASFSIGPVRSDGHMDILGDREAFEYHKDDFVNLFEVQKARMLSEEECLR